MNDHSVIPIVYSSDDNGYILLLVSLQSLIANKSPFSKYHIYIVYRNFSTKMLNFIKDVININKQSCEITYINGIKLEEKYDIPKIHNHAFDRFWPPPVFYWMVANDFLQDLYFIYLDIDTYIQEDLTTMFNQIKDKKLIYGVIDTYQTIRIELQNIKKEHFENISQIYEGYYKKYLALDFHKYLHSINTGSIIVSTKFLSTLDKTAFFSLARENDYMDQDLVNLYCFNNITNIGIRYNFALHMFHGNEMNLRIHSKQNPFTIFNFSKDKLYNKLIEASVIHYSIEIKPTYIFNQLTYELIKKLKSFDDFFNLVTTINNLNNYSLYNSLDQYDQKLLFELNKTWHNQICLDHPSKKEDVFSFSYIQWGKAWLNIMNNISKYKYI